MLEKDILYTPGGNEPQVVSARGAELFCADGTRLIDFQQMAVVLGQGNEHFIRVMEQALRGVRAGSAQAGGWKEQLYRRFEETTGGQFAAYHLTASGSESAEWAVKLARRMTGRTEVLTFWNSIHGRTHLSASMSGLPKRKTGYGPLASGVVFGIYPECVNCPFGRSAGSCGFFCLEFLEKKIQMESAQDIAAVVVEPCQGACAVAPPKGWLCRLREWARKKGMLFILDEIQTGVGRTGEMYAGLSEGLEPDFLLLGKALGNGIHISALLARRRPPRDMLAALSGGTGDDPLCCAAACAVYDELLDHGLLQRAREAGEYLHAGLQSIQGARAGGRGLLASLWYEQAEARDRALESARRAGCRVLAAGERGMAFKPPYCITKEQIDVLLAALRAAE